jgi:hypothetical protein
VLEDHIELSPFDESHAEVQSAVALTDFINWNDAGMIQAGGRFRFQTEALDVCSRRPSAKPDYF